MSAPNSVRVVLHKTESAGFQASLRGLVGGPHSPHFLIGKAEGELVQLINTSLQGIHVENANSFYLGIEFVSIPSRPAYGTKQDPETIRDELTQFQSWIVEWISMTHGISLVGPPSLAELRACHGHWRDFCNHADVSAVIGGRGQHGDGLMGIDFMGLGPSGVNEEGHGSPG